MDSSKDQHGSTARGVPVVMPIIAWSELIGLLWSLAATGHVDDRAEVAAMGDQLYRGYAAAIGMERAAVDDVLGRLRTTLTARLGKQ